MDIRDDKVRTLTLKWDRRSAEEVERAMKRFEEYIKKGWLAFRVTSDNRKVQVYMFDTELEKVVLVPIVEGG